MPEILNNDELDEWLFIHCCILDNSVQSIDGVIEGEEVVLAWVDTETDEMILVEYGC